MAFDLNLPEQKQHLRQTLRQRRRALSLAERMQFSSTIQHLLMDFLQQQSLSGHDILCYHAMPEEVDTQDILSLRTHVYAPVIAHERMIWRCIDQHTAWEKHPHHMLEPSDGETWQASRPSIVICPLVGFDNQGNRLGMGKGYFDRWLSEHQHQLDHRIGLAFSCQEATSIPTEAHDIPVHTLITEQGVIACHPPYAS